MHSTIGTSSSIWKWLNTYLVLLMLRQSHLNTFIVDHVFALLLPLVRNLGDKVFALLVHNRDAIQVPDLLQLKVALHARHHRAVLIGHLVDNCDWDPVTSLRGNGATSRTGWKLLDLDSRLEASL